MATHGAVTFISPLHAGSISDEQIIREFGILSLLRPPGMAIMVDRGFLVDDIVVPSKIYRPAFLSGRSQMSACEVRDTQAIACLKAFPHSAMRKSEANHPRMLLSHRARNECSPSANSRLHARWRRPTMHFSFMYCLYLMRFTMSEAQYTAVTCISSSQTQNIHNAYNTSDIIRGTISIKLH